MAEYNSLNHAVYSEGNEGKPDSFNPTIRPLKSGMTETEMINSYFVADKALAKLIGTIEEPRAGLFFAVPATTGYGKLKGVFQLNDSIKLVPFYLSDDFGIQAFTKWRISTSDSTLTYVSSLAPTLYEKYSFSRIIEKVTVKGKDFFIGETIGGDEGEVRQYLWTARYENNDSFSRVDQFQAAHGENENPKSLTYSVTGNKLTIFLKTDSIVSKPNLPIEEVTIKREIVKTVILD